MGRAMLTLYSAADQAKALDWIRRAPAGTRVTFQGPQRTTPQNDRMWLMLTAVSEEIVWYGQKLSPDDWKDIFTASLRKARVVPGLDPGSFVPLGMRTSTMSKDELSALIELIEAFAADPDHLVRFPWHDDAAERGAA